GLNGPWHDSVPASLGLIGFMAVLRAIAFIFTHEIASSGRGISILSPVGAGTRYIKKMKNARP
ncbi:MAG TPA: hypothetical protein VGQ99_09965, partial [Tepidisphaeraceae bacterium]|nr:hypothetical protein [Tepidisphaeraceae bacterium]